MKQTKSKKRIFLIPESRTKRAERTLLSRFLPADEQQKAQRAAAFRKIPKRDQLVVLEVLRLIHLGQHAGNQLPFTELCRSLHFQPDDTFGKIMQGALKRTREFLASLNVSVVNDSVSEPQHIKPQ